MKTNLPIIILLKMAAFGTNNVHSAMFIITYLFCQNFKISDSNIAMLEKAVPGVPGQDYPIYAEVPETGFECDGQVDGGYYADPEAECQVFHICTNDGAGGLTKYSFLCPNGTVFSQQYFICDWWFNFDCSEAEAFYR